MTYSALITAEAERDIADAIDWFDAISPELTISFIFELTAAMATISEDADPQSPIVRDLHRALLRRFPYSVFYRQGPHAIQVIAVFAMTRDPRRL